MCFDSGSDEAEKEAKRIRAEEAARQKRIRDGTAKINSIFDGGAVSGADQFGLASLYDPNATYYTNTGDIWKPTAPTPAQMVQLAAQQPTSGPVKRNTGLPGGSGGNRSNPNTNKNNATVRVGQNEGAPRPGSNVAATPGYVDPAAQFKSALAGGLFGGTTTSKGAFGEDFFKGREQAFIDYATPQLQQQRGDAARELTFALDRSKLLDSSTRATKEGELGKLYDLNYQDVADKGRQYANDARTKVEDARQDLIKTLNVTGDAEGAASGAINRAASLSQPEAFSPLTQLFSDFTAGLGTQIAMERAEAASGRDYAKYGTGLFRPRNSTVVRT